MALITTLLEASLAAALLLVPSDQATPEEVQELEVACDRGDATACRDAGFKLALASPRENDPRVLSLYQKACDGNHAEACGTLGLWYFNGGPIDQDRPRAAALYEKSCELGHSSACTSVGKMYEAGEGVERDPGRAQAWLAKGCDEGSRSACTHLGLEKAAARHKAACDAGDAIRCIRLGDMYEFGEGVAKDAERARQLFDMACDRGEAVGCEKEGLLYLRALEPPDAAQALALLWRACEMKATQCYTLARVYEYGAPAGVKRDLSRALELFKAACDAGGGMACNKVEELGK